MRFSSVLRVPRTGAAFAGRKRPGVPRGPTTAAPRAAALVSRGCSPGARVVARLVAGLLRRARVQQTPELPFVAADAAARARQS